MANLKRIEGGSPPGTGQLDRFKQKFEQKLINQLSPKPKRALVRKQYAQIAKIYGGVKKTQSHSYVSSYLDLSPNTPGKYGIDY